MPKKARLRDSEKYAVLASALESPEAQEGTRLKSDAVGGYRTKTVRAGEFLYISCYPLISCAADREQLKRLEDFKIQKEKNAKLRAKYAKYNNARRITGFEQLVHTNFVNGDLHVVCTYPLQDYRFYNELEFRTRDDAKRESYNFIRRTKRFLKRCGCDLKEFRWICVTVTKESMDDSARPLPDHHHHHILMHGVPPELRGDIEKLWNYGTCNADRIHDSATGLADVAGYVARQESSCNGENAGQRSYTTSRNIKRPKVTTNDSKISRRRMAQIAADVMFAGREIFEEKLFPGFRLIEDVQVKTSEYVAGAYIYAKLRKRRD